MALLRANVDPIIIHMIGNWKSWVMIQYLHCTATSTSHLALHMLEGGHYTIQEHAFILDDAATLVVPLS